MTLFMTLPPFSGIRAKSHFPPQQKIKPGIVLSKARLLEFPSTSYPLLGYSAGIATVLKKAANFEKSPYK
jgi:hypothetical protein